MENLYCSPERKPLHLLHWNWTFFSSQRVLMQARLIKCPASTSPQKREAPHVKHSPIPLWSAALSRMNWLNTVSTFFTIADRVWVLDVLPPPILDGDSLDVLRFLEFLVFLCTAFLVVLVEGVELVVGEAIGSVLLELVPVALPHRCSLSLVLLKYIDKFGKFQTLVSGAVFTCFEAVHDDSPFFELHSRKRVPQMVYRIQNITVGGDATGVVEIIERLFQQEDEGGFGVGWVYAEGRKYVGAFSPSSLRS